MDKIANIDKAMASLCKRDDKRSDAMMMMTPDSNWDKFLTPAPCAIALLGDLILISADADFSLEENPPRDGFKVLRYPNSFRASLVQVTNAGWSAFNEAHSNMGEIRSLSDNVDDHVKNAVQFLMKGSPDEVENMVPMSLSKIQNIADESALLAKAIEDQFVGVMGLTGELLEACTNTKGVYDEKTKQNETDIEIARTEKKIREKERQDTEKRLRNMENEVKEAQQDFKEAMNEVPSGMGLVGVAICEALIDGVRNITSYASKVTKKKFAADNDTDDSERDDAYFDKESSRRKIYKQVPTITTYIRHLATIITEETDGTGKIKLGIKKSVHDDLRSIRQCIEMARKHVDCEVKSVKLRERVLKLCDDSLAICVSLQRTTKSLADLENKDAVLLEAVNKTKDLKNESQKLEVEASKALERNALDTKSPYLSKMPIESGSSSMVKASTENARYKTELAKETLRDAKRRQEKSVEQLQASEKEMTKVLTDMAKLDMKKIDFDTIRETLVKGIKALAKVREQWGKLVRFFQMLSNLIKCCLNSSLTDFVDQAKIGRQLKMKNHAEPLSNIFRDVIFEQASKAGQIAYVVRTIAAAYVKVSDKHLMDQITCLGHLIGLDAKKDENEIRRKREELYNGCKEAQTDILAIVMKEKEEFNVKVEERIQKFQAIEKAMPPIEPERIKEIQTNVVSGMAAFTDEEIDDLA